MYIASIEKKKNDATGFKSLDFFVKNNVSLLEIKRVHHCLKGRSSIRHNDFRLTSSIREG